MVSSVSTRPVGWIVTLFLLAGCSSISGRGSVDPSAYASMNCNELNETVAGLSTQISRTAINRGRVAQTNIPSWVPGGTRVATAVIDRQTAKIEKLQAQERTVSSARNSACVRR
jgi:outer membrane murein-binding lipoprotein Lpp